MEGPKGKYIFGMVKVGEKGQIVIPKEARDAFDIKPGDSLLMLGDIEQGIAITKPDVMQIFDQVLKQPKKKSKTEPDKGDED